MAPASTPAQRISSRHLGPFEVVGSLGSTGAGTLLVGFDPRLRRRVWLHEVPLDTPSVPPLFRDLNRPGRLRWLAGRRTSTESWDGYEALDGVPLVTLLDRTQPWRVVRPWLADLAHEIDAGLNDGSLGHLGLDRVWITREGRAKLLDFAVPAALRVPTPDSSASATSAQKFLSEVATSALAGYSSTLTDVGRQPRHTLPLSASALLDALARSAIETWSEVVRRTAAIMNGADRVERARRAASVALCAAIPLGMALMSGAVMTAMTRVITAELVDLTVALDLSARPSPGADRAAIETYIAGRFGPMIKDPHTWTDPRTAPFLGRRRPLAERIVANHPHVSPSEMAWATAAVGSLLERQSRSFQSMNPWAIAGFIGAVQFVITAVVGLLSAWLFRGGLLLRAFGIAVVTRNGEHVSRLRALCRGFAAWGLVIVAFCSALLLVFIRSSRPVTVVPPQQVSVLLPLTVLAIGMLAIFLAGAVWAVVRPERGLQDRIAGTYLVPR
jgi:hypothetical protein